MYVSVKYAYIREYKNTCAAVVTYMYNIYIYRKVKGLET